MRKCWQLLETTNAKCYVWGMSNLKINRALVTSNQILVNTTTTRACLCTMLIEMNTLGVQMSYSHAGAKDEENAYT